MKQSILIIMCFLFFSGCFSSVYSTRDITFRPAVLLRDVCPENESWMILSCKSLIPGCLNIIGLRVPWRGYLYIKYDNQTDVWDLSQDQRSREKAEGKRKKYLLDMYEERNAQIYSSLQVKAKRSKVLSVYDYTSSSVSSVFVNVDAIFADNSECGAIWIDDGFDGLAFERGTGLVETIKAEDNPTDFSDNYKVYLKTDDYEKIVNYVNTQPIRGS